ncbi:MAG: 7-cyano-7-deazaguanine synthase [Acidobacteriota bacterium]|nr:7-cyano-7-deazaguanine synthase [Acidobacteriota bacterium]
MDPIKNEVAVMFSGGIDSLLASVLLAQEYDKVHLVTFDKGYLEFGVKNNLPNVDRLKEKFGADRITHQVIDIKDLHRAISVRFFFKERKKYNSEIRWCVGCRLSMNIGAMIFALENNLVGYADGSNREQIPSDANLTGTAENYPSIVNAGKKFAQSYAVHFLTPTYDFGGREMRRQKLGEMGFAIDYLSQDHSKTISGMMTKEVVKRSQPMCFSGWLMHWKRNLLGKPIDQNEDMTVAYVRGKQDNVVREVVAKYFADKGMDIEAIVKARQADPLGQFKPIFV